MITWRRVAKPLLLDAIATDAAHAELHVLRNPRQLRRLTGNARPDAASRTAPDGLTAAEGNELVDPAVVSWEGMQLSEVTGILAGLCAGSCHVWVAGGWGVDALVGHQTRPHRDLDLAVDARDEATAIAILKDRGYQVESDWRPVRVELARADAGWVDLHPVVFDHAGHGRQADLDGGHFDYPPTAFDTGLLDGWEVPCLSPGQQVTFHTGYEPRPVDLHDLQLLHSIEVCGVAP